MNIRIGHGFDVHALAEGETLWLGGVEISHTKGTVAHSDGDVVLHAICDAMFGALALRDIGYHFPDTSIEFKNIDSKKLLAKTIDIIGDHGYTLGNLDVTICAQKPKLLNYIPQMIECVATILNVAENKVSIKATTTERLGFIGKEDGISTHAVVLLEKIQKA